MTALTKTLSVCMATKLSETTDQGMGAGFLPMLAQPSLPDADRTLNLCPLCWKQL